MAAPRAAEKIISPKVTLVSVCQKNNSGCPPQYCLPTPNIHAHIATRPIDPIQKMSALDIRSTRCLPAPIAVNKYALSMPMTN